MRAATALQLLGFRWIVPNTVDLQMLSICRGCGFDCVCKYMEDHMQAECKQM